MRHTINNLPPSLGQLRALFLRLLDAEVCLAIVTVFAVMVLDSISRRSESLLNELSPSESVVLVGYVLFAVLTSLVLIVAWIGLFLRSNWARWLYLGVHMLRHVGIIPIVMFTELTYLGGLPTYLLLLSSLLVGCNLSLLFFSELATIFNGSFVPSTCQRVD